MIPYLAIVLATWIQTANMAPLPAEPLLQRGRIEYIRGHLAAAEQLIKEALGELRQDDETMRASALEALGNVYAQQEEYGKAEDAYSQSLLLWRRLSDRNNSALLLHNLGMLRAHQGGNEEALKFLAQALQLVQSASPGDPAIKAQVLNGIGIVYYRRNNNSAAEKSFKQALEIIRTRNIPFNTAGVMNNLGAVYLKQHRFRQAEDFLNRALQIKEAEEGLSDPDLIPELTTLGAIYTETGRYAEAEQQYKRSLKILDPERPEFATKIARVLHSLSSTYSRAGRRSESEEALSNAAKIARDNLNKDPEMAQILEDYSLLLESRGNVREAANLQAQARHARLVAALVVRRQP